MKTKFTKRLIQIISIVCILSCLCSSVSAYTTTTSGKNTISPSNSQLDGAKKTKYTSKSKTISDSIGKKYEMDIIHYEAPKAGYYAIYTTGSTDTLGKVYEEENFLWWTTEYKVKGITQDDSGLGLNYRHVLNLDKYEDYYICTRAYNTKTGNYKLVIEPNDDARESNVGGRWINDSATFSEGNTETTSKIYLTAAQAKIYYQMIRHKETKAAITNSYTKKGIIGTLEDLVDLGFGTIELISIFDPFSVKPITAIISSLGITFTEGVIKSVLQSFYEDVDSLAYILGKLEECGAGYHTKNGIDVYYAKNGVCITTECVKTVIDNPFFGRRVTKYSYSNSYSTYNSTEMVGEEYETGHWI